MSDGRNGQLRSEQNDVKRKAQVTQQDHAEFSKDFQKKRLRDQQRDPIERELMTRDRASFKAFSGEGDSAQAANSVCSLSPFLTGRGAG